MSDLLFNKTKPAGEQDTAKCGESMQKSVDKRLRQRREEELEAERKRWRTLGTVGKAHNIVKHVRLNPQHRAAYVNHQMEGVKKEMLQQDNDTRWGSTWKMVDIFLRHRDQVEMYINLTKGLEKEKLTDVEWGDLEALKKMLEPFKVTTILGQGQNAEYGSIPFSLVAYEMLLSVLETEKKKIRPNESTYTYRLEKAWAKLDKYYQRTDDTAAYHIAMILDPRIKMKYFECNWATKLEWVIEAEEKMHQIYHEYKGIEDKDLEVNHEDDSEDNSFNIDVLRFGRPEQRKDELIRYLTSDTVIARQKNFNLMEWWKANETEYPTLARIAFDILSIPCMSVESERAFSG